MMKARPSTFLPFLLLTVLAALLPCGAWAKTLYVAPAGNDTNTGNLTAPFATITRAQSAASAGDTVYLRGGNYTLTNAQISQTDRTYAYVNYLSKAGIKYLAYAGETPVFDFSKVKPANLRFCAFFISGDNITLQGFEIVGVQVTIANVHTQSECIRVESSNNIFRLLKMHDGMGIGLYMVKNAGHNLVENCDAYNNCGLDNGSIGNIDGFGCHVNKGSTGNIFRGCRSWGNSDDAYDCIHCAEPVTFDHCWAMDSGFQGGDGNGFKISGWAGTLVERLPNPIPRHTVIFCLSVHNKAHGFYANHQPGGAANWYNNTAYNNRFNFDLLERTSDNVKDIPGVNEVLHNNLAFKAITQDVHDLNETGDKVSHNSWTLPVTVKDSDFVSLDPKQLTGPRQADGSLPKVTFMHLTPHSDLIDQGLDVGLPFKGKAPDLGCFESESPAEASDAATITNSTTTKSR
jgi:hypothetical protein